MSARWTNQAQSNSMLAGTLLFIPGGMNLALGLGWNYYISVPTTEHLQFSWFIGFIVGAFIAAPLITFVQKRWYMLFSGILVLAGGIIFTSAPDNYDAILAARYINGFAIGFAVIPFLVLGSEIGVRSYRGTCLSLEQYGLALGIMIQIVYATQWSSYYDFSANRLHGIITIVIAVFALGATYSIIESPIYYLRKGDEGAALESLRRLQRPYVVTDATRAQLEELKLYMQEDRDIYAPRTHMPLLKAILFRAMVPFTFTLPLNLTIFFASTISMGYVDSWPPIVYGVLRFLGTFLPLWLMDGLGRKSVSLFSLLIIGGLTIGIGSIFNDSVNLLSEYKMSVVCTLSLLIQFFAGLFVPATSAFLGEAFHLSAKPYCMALCVIVEQVIQIIIICTFTFGASSIFAYCIATGVIMIVFTLLFFVSIPETRSTTLREANNRFTQTVYISVY
ncbi:facilitated trehalose transporter Tret1-2 homolog [Teleopsis dalmanni]|uniref:facilitated trehalose transporter Tret1-2 homolog n=1 Tax=Teleopsis dalmanni TaxID=139649 RepID=UPI0018CEE2E3|nr:facilitated trehalose transporter Tret1-2 homolog [Teleopsis dalmanni]